MRVMIEDCRNWQGCYLASVVRCLSHFLGKTEATRKDHEHGQARSH